MTFVALAGNPNCGKTTLFNALTGLNQQVGNYPGITVERRAGKLRADPKITLVDLPGTYSLLPRSKDEAIAFEVLTGRGHEPKPALTVLVVDASNLDRNLYLALSILELGMPCVVALNMIDVARQAGLAVDIDLLSQSLAVPVVPIVAKSGDGVDKLEAAITAALKAPPQPGPRAWKLDPATESAFDDVATHLKAHARADGEAVWLLATLSALRSHPDSDLEASLSHLGATNSAKAHLAQLPHLSAAVIEARYAVATQLAESCLTREPNPRRSLTDRLDAVLLHPVWGATLFIAVMALLFQSIFAGAEPLMGAIEGAVGWAQDTAGRHLPEGALRELLLQGVIGGVGNVVVFVPQIAILFGFIAILEDSGYLARAAFLADRTMAKVGLHGRAFVPLLSGFACAIPAVMATRAIESWKDRLVTILVAPLMSCSARLPVYTLIIAALFASDQTILGIFTVGGLLMLAMYLLSIIAAIGMAFLFKRTILKSPTPPLVLELPPYRLPELKSVLRRVVDRATVFVRDAGTVILALSIVLWALMYFPRQVELSFDPVAEKAQVTSKFELLLNQNPTASEALAAQQAEALAELEQREGQERLRGSFAGYIGRALEPLIAPLGFDWKIGIGLIASFAAREVFVSTMGLVYGVADADESSEPLRDKLRNEQNSLGRPVYTPLVGLALMVFFVLAAQCMSTVAVVRRETNSWRWPVFMVVYMNALAWLGGFIVYQGGKLLGFQ